MADTTEFILHDSAGCEHLDTVLFAGDVTNLPGIMQLKGTSVCQAFVPTQTSPGSADAMQFGFVASAFNGKVLVSYFDHISNSYLIECSTTNRQNGAILRTLWHRGSTDQRKVWRGIKLNLKAIPSGCFAQVAYRTERDTAFLDSGVVLSVANQDQPVYFTTAPRSRKIQFRITFLTNGADTPELLSYDTLFEVSNAIR